MVCRSQGSSAHVMAVVSKSEAAQSRDDAWLDRLVLMRVRLSRADVDVHLDADAQMSKPP